RDLLAHGRCLVGHPVCHLLSASVIVMRAHILSPTGTWLILVIGTLLSYLSVIEAQWVDPRVAGSVVILIALVKAWLIGMRFMELDEAVLPLKFAYNAWVATVGVILLTALALAP
ncbi:MAG: cytochrome C oxidase subunit IV family protein, partial [Pyrinomonadaceae bacterium]